MVPMYTLQPDQVLRQNKVTSHLLVGGFLEIPVHSLFQACFGEQNSFGQRVIRQICHFQLHAEAKLFLLHHAGRPEGLHHTADGRTYSYSGPWKRIKFWCSRFTVLFVCRGHTRWQWPGRVRSDTAVRCVSARSAFNTGSTAQLQPASRSEEAPRTGSTLRTTAGLSKHKTQSIATRRRRCGLPSCTTEQANSPSFVGNSSRLGI